PDAADPEHGAGHEHDGAHHAVRAAVRILIGTLMTALRIALAAGLSAAAFGQTDWPTFGHDLGGSRYSTLKQIDTSNVTKLVRAWTYHMSAGAAPTAAPAAPAAGSSEAG